MVICNDLKVKTWTAEKTCSNFCLFKLWEAAMDPTISIAGHYYDSLVSSLWF